ncbi:DUF397 domain-containing protein [Nocardiopsis ansamitocini]|uniref:DUF397 domain-containing protein n=1 Tax=Nocardiopsis ansamitocini TaxID=1670832 RepID=A0A9W6P2F2_9ACTN|nr:DUF397 domain-containing protein [Nocardiopsis ansamitocini]GLU45894.1 hypothetical protein Nans01_02450 [Nocardiopsis ansamitocini]
MEPTLNFRKSSYSGQAPNYAEVAPLRFRTSSHSGQDQNCLEVAPLTTGAALRDSKHPHHGHLTFPATEWDAFLTAARDHAL